MEALHRLHRVRTPRLVLPAQEARVQLAEEELVPDLPEFGRGVSNERHPPPGGAGHLPEERGLGPEELAHVSAEHEVVRREQHLPPGRLDDLDVGEPAAGRVLAEGLRHRRRRLERRHAPHAAGERQGERAAAGAHVERALALGERGLEDAEHRRRVVAPDHRAAVPRHLPFGPDAARPHRSRWRVA
jgi:hypothetical protein